MTELKKVFLTARESHLMRQEGREVLAVPLHPQTHASFVGVYHTYKMSEETARSKLIKGVNEPQNRCFQ